MSDAAYKPGPDWEGWVKGSRKFMVEPGGFHALELLDDGSWAFVMRSPVLAEGTKVPPEVAASWTRPGS